MILDPGGGALPVQEYEPPTLPSGFVFKFVLMSTWDDRFYIGLNGLELYDQFDRPVQASLFVCVRARKSGAVLLLFEGRADCAYPRLSIVLRLLLIGPSRPPKSHIPILCPPISYHLLPRPHPRYRSRRRIFTWSAQVVALR